MSGLALADQLRMGIGSLVDPTSRSRLGQFMTPGPVASFMARLFEELPDRIRLLDAGAGFGSLTAAFVHEACMRSRRPSSIHVTAFEIDTVLAARLNETMQACADECLRFGIEFAFRIVRDDYILHSTEPLMAIQDRVGPFDCAILKGDVDFGVGTGPFQLPLFAKGELPPIQNFYEWCYPYRWDIAVLPDSEAQSYADLKGKTIGVSALGTTDYPIARAALTNVGVDPDKDVSWLATGAGVPAGVALQRGTIDALAYFDTGFGQVEAAGIPIRILPRPDKTPMIGGLYVSGNRDFIEKNQDLAVSFGRSISRASQFILASPEAGAKVFLKMYPELAPRGASEEDAVKTLLYPIKRRMAHFEPPYPDTKMGFIHADELVREAEFLGLNVESADAIVRTDLVDRIDDYDLEKVKQHAASYNG